MFIEISGHQQVGKSTIIEGIQTPFTLYKFPMGNVCKELSIRPTWEFQVAKDISALQFSRTIGDETLLVGDRGPLSSIFYSILFNRASSDDIHNFVQYLTRYKDIWKPVWVTAVNRNIQARSKNDGFDNLQDLATEVEVYDAETKMDLILREYGFNYYHHINDFATPVESNIERFNLLITRITNGEI